MLIECPECKGQVSDQAESCPHCGFLLKAKAATIAKPVDQPIWLAAASLALLLTFFVPPRISAVLVLMTVVAAGVSLYKREAGRWWAFTMLGLLVLVFFANYPAMTGREPAPVLSASPGSAEADHAGVEIADWNWSTDAGFAGRGAVIWNVQISNKTDRNVAAVRVQLTTYNAEGKMITSDDTYVNAIPAGGEGAGKGYGDYYGTESKADIRIVSVRFAR